MWEKACQEKVLKDLPQSMKPTVARSTVYKQMLTLHGLTMKMLTKGGAVLTIAYLAHIRVT